MADTGDLKSPAHKACGFESRQPHKTPLAARGLQGAFAVDQKAVSNSFNGFKGETQFCQRAHLGTDPAGFTVFQADHQPDSG